MIGWSAYNISNAKPENYPSNIELVTSAAKSVGIKNLLRGDILIPGFSLNADGTTSATGFGDASPVFNFDDNNKVISVTNVFEGNARGRTFTVNPAATADQNVYDPVKKTLIVNFLFKQNGRPNCVCIWKMTFAKDRS